MQLLVALFQEVRVNMTMKAITKKELRPQYILSKKTTRKVPDDLGRYCSLFPTAIDVIVR